MGHVEVNGVGYALPDGRPLLRDVSFRVDDGSVTALVGPNGTGKTTLLAIVAGDLAPDEGSTSVSGELAVMRQFVGSIRDGMTVHELLVRIAPLGVRTAAERLDAAETEMIERDDERSQIAYSQALADWGDVGGYRAEVYWDSCTTEAIGLPLAEARWRRVASLSGGEQKRLVLHTLLGSPADVVLLDEPDNYEPTDNLDVESAEALEAGLETFDGTVLAVTHDRYFARSFDRFVLFCAGGEVLETDGAVWSESALRRRGAS